MQCEVGSETCDDYLPFSPMRLGRPAEAGCLITTGPTSGRCRGHSVEKAGLHLAMVGARCPATAHLQTEAPRIGRSEPEYCRFHNRWVWDRRAQTEPRVPMTSPCTLVTWPRRPSNPPWMATADPSTIADLFWRYGPMVRRRARALLGNDSDADEAVQEIFMKVLNQHDLQDGEGKTSWFYRITTNHCLNQIRDRKRRAKLLERHVAPVEQGRSSPAADQLATLRWLLANSDEREAACAVYVYLDGMGHDEAAQILGVSSRTVRNLLSRFSVWARDVLEPAPGSERLA